MTEDHHMPNLRTPSHGILRTPIPWIRLDAPILNSASDRSPERYNAVIDQFDVETNPRYVPRDDKTYCNIFVWDVTRAMEAEIPHWTNASGEPVSHETKDAIRMNCNAMCNWLHSLGLKYGWHKVQISQAVQAAAQGHPSIAIFCNPDGNGHVAMILPDQPTKDGHLCAQAGKQCLRRVPLSAAFGSNKPEFWMHE